MGVPGHLLVHDVTVVRPASTTDAYGNSTHDYGPAATRRPMRAWLQQDQRMEPHRDGRDPEDERWLLVANDPDVTAVDRIEWAGHPVRPVVFRVEGPPEAAYTPQGFHHTEATLRITEG